MVTPELKWPITNLTPLPANLLAIETPCLGSDTSSPLSRAIFWPRIPPLALMSATACSVPFLICAPKEAFGPVIGPPTPNLTWAAASPAAPHAQRQAERGEGLHACLPSVSAIRLPRACGQRPPQFDRIESKFAAKVI